VSPASTPSSSSGGQVLPVTGGKIIGTPYQGTHAKAFNVAGGSDNWESENAVDIAVPIGTPVYAVADGTIGPQFGSLGEGGRFAGLRLHLNAGADSFYYAHLSSFAPGIRPGKTVTAGTLLGYSGSANGVAHLHFASTTNLDPLSLVKGLPDAIAAAAGGGGGSSDPSAGDAADGSSSGGLPSALTSNGCATIALYVLAVGPVLWLSARWWL